MSIAFPAFFEKPPTLADLKKTFGDVPRPLTWFDPLLRVRLLEAKERGAIHGIVRDGELVFEGNEYFDVMAANPGRPLSTFTSMERETISELIAISEIEILYVEGTPLIPWHNLDPDERDETDGQHATRDGNWRVPSLAARMFAKLVRESQPNSRSE